MSPQRGQICVRTLSDLRTRAGHGEPSGRTPLPSWLVYSGGIAITGIPRSRPLTGACSVAHTAGDNYIRSLTSPGGVGANTKADRDGSHLGWKLPQPPSAEGRPGVFAVELRRIPRGGH